MAARRLLIVMLILLGLSTLAAALVPQHSLRGTTDTRATTTTTAQAPTTTNGPSPGYLSPTRITVGGREIPVVSPLHVGDQVNLEVRSKIATQLSIPRFGLVGFAAPNAPALFALLADSPGTFGILFEPSGRVAGKIEVVSPKEKPKARKKKAG